MNQSVYKMIEVLFCEEQIEVTVELFNHDDEVTFSIESATFGDVDVLNIIDSLGGLSNLSEAVEQALNGGE